MRTTPIILDRLDASLNQHGVRLKRSQLLETAAMAFGYHNSGEFSSAAKAGDLTPPRPEVLGTLTADGVTLVAMRDQSGGVYAIEESFLEQVVDEERRETFGPSPYGGLVDLSAVTSQTLPEWARRTLAVHDDDAAPRYVAVGGENRDTLIETDDLEAARKACHDEEGKLDLDTYVIDRMDWTISRSRCCWRIEEMPSVQPSLSARADTAAELHMARVEREDVEHKMEQILACDVPDWRRWEKSLKKASHKKQDPISDEILHQFRHAVADVTSKSSSSEKFEVTYRQQRYVEKHLGGLLARLDRAEEALREAGIAPAEISRKSKDDASERLAAIEAVDSRRGGQPVLNLFQVNATRDGETCDEIFEIRNDDDPEEVGRKIAAKAFRMDIYDFRNENGGHEDFDGECDTFSVAPVLYPEVAGIIDDVLILLASSGLGSGMTHDHPARVKLLAAASKVRPKATIQY